MRYSASERAEIIRLVEQSHLPAKRTLDYGTGNIPETPGFLISGSGPEADFVPRPGHVNFSSESRTLSGHRVMFARCQTATSAGS